MKTFAPFIVSGLVALSVGTAAQAQTNVLPQSATQAASNLSFEQKRAALLAQSRKNIDTMSTGSIKTADAYDARGVVQPNAEITLAAGLAAKIDDLPFKGGQAFKKGDVLVKFDCARQQADLRGAKAQLSKASSTYSGKKRLKARGAAGSQEVKDAAADVATAKAKVDSIDETMRLCYVIAPFSGRVVERHAEMHEIPAANAPIMTIVDDSALELDLIVPSRWLRWVKAGSEFEFEVDELGQSFRAQVVRLGAKVDAVSQTIKMTGKFTKRPGQVLAGMSGTAKFSPPTN